MSEAWLRDDTIMDHLLCSSASPRGCLKEETPGLDISPSDVPVCLLYECRACALVSHLR